MSAYYLIRVLSLLAFFLACTVVDFNQIGMSGTVGVLIGTLGLFLWNEWLYQEIFPKKKTLSYPAFEKVGVLLAVSVFILFLYLFVVKV